VSEMESLFDLDNGRPMYVYAGTGLADAAIIEAVTESMYEEPDGLIGYRLEIREGNWGWSPRMKHCSNHDSGWGCDQEGDWHQHFSSNYSGDPVTVVTVFSPTWNPSPHPDARLVLVGEVVQ
jgi:hypothetical protein